MKIILAVVRDIDSDPVINTLVNKGFRVTRLASTGGFLRRGNVTLLIGIDEDQVETLINLLKETVSEPEIDQHRVTLFVMDAIGFEQI